MILRITEGFIVKLVEIVLGRRGGRGFQGEEGKGKRGGDVVGGKGYE